MLQSQVFKANDIRGVIGSQWDAGGAWALGRAFAELVDSAHIVVGRDNRVSSLELQTAFIAGVISAGVSVIDISLASTDGLWFASGFLDIPGAQITASHNTGAYNGLKLCLSKAQPVSSQFLTDLADRAQRYDRGPVPAPTDPQGSIRQQDTLPDYVSYLLQQVDTTSIRPLRVVVDAGNGMAGVTAPAVLEHLNVEVIGLYLDLDGEFPNHPANPLVPANLVDAQKAVRTHSGDVGFVFDCDADRVVVIDETGAVVAPSAITAMIAVQELTQEPGATIIVNTATSKAVSEIVESLGGNVVTSKVGHTYMKAMMAAHNAIFGGEHSAHYYFRGFFGADTGMLATLYVLAALGTSDLRLSSLVSTYTNYAASGEINSTVGDPSAAMAGVVAEIGDGAALDWTDGVKISTDHWWVSLRPSNTEPLLRLNVEASEEAVMIRLRDKVLSLIKEE